MYYKNTKDFYWKVLLVYPSSFKSMICDDNHPKSWDATQMLSVKLVIF